MKTTIVYLHGWGGSPQSQTAKDIKKSFPKEDFICPQIEHSSDPDLIKKQMDALGKKLMNQHDVIIVGSSAGGFWADYIGSVYGIKTVLINPSLHPATNFVKFKLPEDYYGKYAHIQKFIKNHTRHHMVAFVGDKDDVVPMKQVYSHYKKPTVLKDEGHRLNNLTPVVRTIQSLIGNFLEHQE